MPIGLPSLPIGLLRGNSLAAKVAALFANGEQGAWYDYSDFSTLFQDSAGTTPVTAVGQPIGLVLDKSGRGNHQFQITAAARPTLQKDGTGRYYSSFDGIDDRLDTASVNFTSTDKMTICAGVRKLNDSALSTVVTLGEFLPVGSFGMWAPTTALPNFGGSMRGSGAAFGAASTSTYAAPSTAVVTLQQDLAGLTAPTTFYPVRVNGAVSGTGGASLSGGGTYSNNPLYVGRRGSGANGLTGRIYGLIVRGAASNAADIAAMEAYMNQKTGAF